jgi:hypothetical protein
MCSSRGWRSAHRFRTHEQGIATTVAMSGETQLAIRGLCQADGERRHSWLLCSVFNTGSSGRRGGAEAVQPGCETQTAAPVEKRYEALVVLPTTSE